MKTRLEELCVTLSEISQTRKADYHVTPRSQVHRQRRHAGAKGWGSRGAGVYGDRVSVWEAEDVLGMHGGRTMLTYLVSLN